MKKVDLPDNSRHKQCACDNITSPPCANCATCVLCIIVSPLAILLAEVTAVNYQNNNT